MERRVVRGNQRLKRIAAVVVAIGLAVALVLLARTGDEQGPAETVEPASGLVGRVLMIGFEGRDAGHRDVRRTLARLSRGEIAGVMFLRRNVGTGEEVRALAARLHAAVPPAEAPPLVAVDQEGGRVARLGWRAGFPAVAAPRAVAERFTPEEAEAIYARMAGELRRLGFNVNFAPVVDVHHDANPIIGRLGRSFGQSPAVVTAYAGALVRAHRREGVLTALKHFPGHGSSRADSHLGAVDVTDTWSPAELEPFAALAGEAPMVMSAHTVNRNVGASGPATLSRAALVGVLREQLGFAGVVVSDDLQMDAIADLHGEERAAELALRAGVDLLLFANDGRADPTLVPRVTAHLERVARADAAFRQRLREAGDRVDRLRRLATGGPSS